MSLLNTIPSQLNNMPDDTELSFYMRVGSIMWYLKNEYGLNFRPIEHEVFHDLRREEVRRRGHDEDFTFSYEPKPKITFKTLQERFEGRVQRCVDYYRENSDGRGRVSIQNREGYEIRTKSVDVVADFLASEDPGIMPQHVREARERFRKTRASGF